MTLHPLFIPRQCHPYHAQRRDQPPPPVLPLCPRFFKKILSESSVHTITLTLERIIDENNEPNFEYLREIEIGGDAMSKSLIEELIAKKKIAMASIG